jgi:hypothetical protein
VLFLRAADDKIAFLREYFDPVRAAKALDTPILGLESWRQIGEEPVGHEAFRMAASVADGRETPTTPWAWWSQFRFAHDARCHGWLLPAGHMGSNEGALLTPSRISNPLKTEWRRHVLASSGYLELGMFDAAALVLEEIAPEEKTRNEVLGARVNLYMAAKKWDMAAAVASHLVKVEPENDAW